MIDDRLPIIDAHHHLWDLSLGRQPWLSAPPWLPFRYGDYAAIRRDFLAEDYRHVTKHHHVVATVTMEAEWDERHLVDETEWMAELHRRDARLPAAHVARTILHAPTVEEELARQAAFPFVKGIRHKPVAATDRERIETGVAGGMSDPQWRRGFAMLHTYGLHFELQAPWWHVQELMDLISAHPDTPIVINHAFMPADRSPEALAGWRQAVKLAARAPHVAMKISGFGIAGRGWPLEEQKPIVQMLLEAFGPERCLFASNFPVDGLTGSFDDIVATVVTAADLSADDRAKVFHDTAIRIYRLDVPPIANAGP